MSAQVPPLSLGLVRWGWKAPSLTCPRLWASIYINVVDIAEPWLSAAADIQELQESHGLFETRVEEWVNRSGSLPLVIYYMGVDYLYNPL